jgi:hypothetical protein
LARAWASASSRPRAGEQRHELAVPGGAGGGRDQGGPDPGNRGHVGAVEQIAAAFVRGEQGGQVVAGLAQPPEELLDRAERLLVQLGLRHHQRKEPGLGFVPGPQHRRGDTRLLPGRAAGSGIG